METAASASPENVIALNVTDAICRDGPLPPAANETERKRQILFRAFEVTAIQLTRDAEQMETHAILDEQPLKKRHEMMQTAHALRVAVGWIHGALLPAPTAPHA